MTIPVASVKPQASQDDPRPKWDPFENNFDLPDIDFNWNPVPSFENREWSHLKQFYFSTRVENWRVWNHYEFKPDSKHPYKGREITNVNLNRYVLRGNLHVWGPIAVFMDVGWQDAGVGYDRKKKTEPFKVNVDIDTKSPSSFAGPGAQIFFSGEEHSALFPSRYMESCLETSTSFVLTHREIEPNRLELDLGNGLKADLADIADHYIKTNEVTYQMMYAEMMWKMKYSQWKFLQPFAALGPNYMDMRSYVQLEPAGERLLKKGGVQWSEVRKNLDFKQWAARYEVGLSSDLLSLGGLLFVLGQGFGFEPDAGKEVPVKVIASYQWAYIPENLPFVGEGRNHFWAYNTTGGVEVGYQF